MLGGGAYAGVSYLQTQNRLTNSQQQLAEMEKENRKLTQRTEMLENENEEYTQHINEIQMKTEELENNCLLYTSREDIPHFRLFLRQVCS